MTKLLLDEYPLIVLPSLACLVGLNQALFLQQVHYWCEHYRRRGDKRHFHNGRWWVYNAVSSRKDVPDWQEQFPFMSPSTIRRVICYLVDVKLLLTANYNLRAYDRTGWYSVDYEELERQVEVQGAAEREQTLPCSQSEQMEMVNLTKCIVSDRVNGDGQSEQMDHVSLTTPIPETTRDFSDANQIWHAVLAELEMLLPYQTYVWLGGAELAGIADLGDGQYAATIVHSADPARVQRLDTVIKRSLAAIVGAQGLDITYEQKDSQEREKEYTR